MKKKIYVFFFIHGRNGKKELLGWCIKIKLSGK